ncbi:MAG: hypothetical protein ACQEQF_07090 [Bacillota bacterium]
MLYKFKNEKELFKKIAPEINKLKEIFKKNNLQGTVVEFNIIDSINNEILYLSNGNQFRPKRLKNNFFLKLINSLEKETQEEIKKIIYQIIDKINNFEKEYMENIE